MVNDGGRLPLRLASANGIEAAVALVGGIGAGVIGVTLAPLVGGLLIAALAMGWLAATIGMALQTGGLLDSEGLVCLFIGFSLCSERCSEVAAADKLFVDEFLDAHVAELAAIARVLDAAERQFGIGPVEVVDEQHPGIDAAGDAQTARFVLRPHRAPQTEVGVVGQRDGFVFTVDAEE